MIKVCLKLAEIIQIPIKRTDSYLKFHQKVLKVRYFVAYEKILK